MKTAVRLTNSEVAEKQSVPCGAPAHCAARLRQGNTNESCCDASPYSDPQSLRFVIQCGKALPVKSSVALMMTEARQRKKAGLNPPYSCGRC